MLTSFVADVVRQFNIGPAATQVGVVRFSDVASDEILLGSVNDRLQLITQITDIQYPGGGRSTHLGIQSSHSQITRFSRSDFTKVMIVATGGVSSVPSLTVEQARLAKEDGIVIIALGIGGDVDLNELTSIATSSEHVILIEQFSAAAFSSMLNSLISQICFRECV